MKQSEAEQPERPSDTPIVAMGLLAFCTGVVILLIALVLGFHIAGSLTAEGDTAKGQRIAIPAAIAVIAGIVTLGGRRHSWAVKVGWVAVAAAVVAVLLAVLLPDGEDALAMARDLHIGAWSG